MEHFHKTEIKVFRKLNTPIKIQNFLDALPINFEKNRETCYSPRLVLKHSKAHCMEGAILAAAALKFHGHPPLLLNLIAHKDDLDHVVAPFRVNKKWGAISKTNHAVLRYREPVYSSIRELVMSYFHEYFLDDGRKTLRSYTNPINLSRFDKRGWTTSDNELWYIDEYVDTVKKYSILPNSKTKLKPASSLEIKAGKLTEWKP